MNFSDVIIPGDKIDIKIIRQINLEEKGGDPALIYQSSVCDHSFDKDFEISMPTNGGRMILFHEGERCRFVFYTKNGLFSCEGEVQKRYRDGNLHLLSVHMDTEPVKFQRREFFRVEYIAPVEYYKITDEVAACETTEELYQYVMQEEQQDVRRSGIIQDISGGGVRFISDEKFETGNCILLVIHLSNMRINKTFFLVSSIVESKEHPVQEEKYVHRAKFLFKNLKDRDRIVRFVFEEERKIRKKEMG